MNPVKIKIKTSRVAGLLLNALGLKIRIIDLMNRGLDETVLFE